MLPTDDAVIALERYEQVHRAVGWWPVQIVLFGVICLSLFHCAHRIRHILMDFGLRHHAGLLMLPCYGGAAAGTVFAAIFLWTL